MEMLGVLSILAILIEYPWLALVPAVLFFWLYSSSKSKSLFILNTAISWLAYVPYEYGMKLRLLCSGECNIRVDLLLIYAVLVVASVGSLIVFALNRRTQA